MKHRFLALSLGLGVLILATQHAFAQTNRNCAPRDQVISRLATKYGETRQSIGLGSNNAVVEVFASIDTGTWSITVTMPTGVTCLVASGQGYETLAEIAEARGRDT